jgi:Asp-tRNA(Asn)/Glu-tRNA(Gln) amidotransferase C subunit
MKTYNQNSDIRELMKKFEELEAIFDKVTIINTSAVETETDTAKKTTTIRASSEIKIAPEDYVLLCKKIEELRSDFIS